jgi:pantetheine-phosphate adenylyltransferase
MSCEIAIYPGTFDPITNGHLDIIKRASKLFDKLIVGVSENKSKNPLFNAQRRLTMAQEVTTEFTNVEVKIFDTLLVDFASKEGVTVVVRGLRAVSDFEYEFQMACVNSKLNKNLETIFLPSNDSMHFISSRFVKSIAELGGDISQFVPAQITRHFNVGKD